ncbi:MAG TPA: Trm112 family protein [Terriglobales bacterium]|nr:Trm112 family protein [Terriglobales bacterium]
MPIAQELLEILVCPLCKQSVTLTDQRDGLRCSACGRIYPVIDDIPVMLVDRARQDS